MKLTSLAWLITVGGIGMQTLTAAEATGAAAQKTPPQVLVEAVIIEVALDGLGGAPSSELGRPPWSMAGYGSGLEAIDRAARSLQTKLVSPVSTNAANGPSGGFGYTVKLANDLDSMLTALSRDSHVRILQRPRIQTSHAVPASLFVGETRPYPSQGGHPNIQQIQIGTSLDIIPFIMPDGLITMGLRLRIDRFAGNVTIKGVGDVPTVSSREAQAKLALRNRDTVLLGGLVGTDKTPVKAYLRFPKDLPVPAVLSSRSLARFERSECLILLRPTLLAG